MTRNVFIGLVLLMTSCTVEKEKKPNAVLYLSNYSFYKFDKAFVKVLADDNLIIADSVNNRYLSFYWQDSAVSVPNRDFKLSVKINGKGFEVEKDTTISYRDSLKMFVTFKFEPYYKRYTNPEIYKYFERETSRLYEIADSLYSIKALSNAGEYLNDTIPLKSSIRINIK